MQQSLTTTMETAALLAHTLRPGDIIGCDWDGALVVPLEIAEDVLAVAARIAVDDKKARRRLYDLMLQRFRADDDPRALAITPDDLHLGDEHLDAALDLIAVCRV